jgi:2-phosphoglycerate kinase
MKRHSFKVVLADDKIAFNLGAVVESLQGAGLLTDEAIRLARALEKHYRQKNAKEVKLEALVSTLHRLVDDAYGAEAAARFLQQPPPFAPLKVRDGDEEAEVFSRRNLAASLEKLGYSFKEANTLARQVEQELRRSGSDQVTPPELAHQTALVIGTRYGPEARARFEAVQGEPSELWVLPEDGVRVPYSRGILAQSLMSLGLAPELSHRLAKRTEVLLWRLGKRELPVAVVRASVKRLLLQEAGEEFVRRYELLHALRRPDQPLIILIGGAPGVGKSNLASALAYRLGLPRIVSTDAIRQALRSLISPELSPELHTSSFTAWRAELLPSESPKPKRKRVVRGFQRQVQQLAAPLQAILSRSVEEASSIVLEGIHLVPGFFLLDELGGATVVELVLTVSDPELHQSYFGARETQTHSRRRREHYLTHFDEIRMIQDFCVAQAKAEGVPILEAGDFDELVDRAIEQILDAALVERAEPLSSELEALTRELEEA